MKRWLLPLFALASGACAPAYSVVRQAKPNPIAGQTRLALLPLEWSRWEDESRDFARDFQSRLTGSVASRIVLVRATAVATVGFTVRCSVRRVGGGRGSTDDVTLWMQLVDSANSVVDEVSAIVFSSPPRSGQRMGGQNMSFDDVDPSRAADALASYLMARTASGTQPAPAEAAESQPARSVTTGGP